MANHSGHTLELIAGKIRKDQNRIKNNKPVFSLSLNNIMLELCSPLAHISSAECKLNICCMQSSLRDEVVVGCL